MAVTSNIEYDGRGPEEKQSGYKDGVIRFDHFILARSKY